MKSIDKNLSDIFDIDPITPTNVIEVKETAVVEIKDSTIEDDGSITLTGKTWSNIHNYQVVDEVEEILTKGYYDFYLWEDFKNGENFKNPWQTNW